MQLDPGIDHLYAIDVIDRVHREGGKILAFRSFCGGLTAPESTFHFGYFVLWDKS